MQKQRNFYFVIIIISIVFILSVIALFFGDFLAATFDVIGIRIAALFVSIAAFGSSTFFSLMVYMHNKTVSQINDDSNKRAELFRELQFASDNYSVIEFNDRMLIQKESDRYLKKYYNKDTPSFHMEHEKIDLTKEILFYTIRIPFKVVEGKTAGNIKLSKIRFEKDLDQFDFLPLEHEKVSQSYILYNEKTRRNNLIMNIVFNKDNLYFEEDGLNVFTKIKIYLEVTSILGVTIEGFSELYFTNPTQIEGNGLHTYKINSSNFRLTTKPYIDKEIEY